MFRPSALVLAGCAVAVALSAASCSPSYQRDSAGARHESAAALAKGHALVQQRQYDEAIDTFVRLAGDESVQAEAVSGAAEALVHKSSRMRLPQRVDAALELGKRLPANGASRPELGSAVSTLLVDPVVEEARLAKRLLDNRRAFVEAMRDDDEGDVMPAPSQRAMTGDEALRAKERLHELDVPRDVVLLYRYARPLAAVLDRFSVDDQRYLAEEGVTNSQLDEIEQSCDMLAETLNTVQLQLDRMRPGWREQ